MAAVIAAGTVPSLPSVWAKTAKDLEIVCFQELPEETLYQQVAYGTRKSSLDLPRYLYAGIREIDEDTENADAAANVTATASDAESSPATPSDATPSEADTGDWKRVRVRWVLNGSFSEQEEYDGEVPGIYVFDAELARDRYVLGDGELPQIEVEVLEKEEKIPEEEVPEEVLEEEVPESEALEIEGETEPFAWETTIDGVEITLAADPGVFPDDVEVLADRIAENQEDSGNARKAVQAALAASAAEGTPMVEIGEIWLFDICVRDGDGETVRPNQLAGSAVLTFTLTDIENDDTDDATEETILQLFSMERGGSEVKALSNQTFAHTVSTEADSFSLYPLVKLREASVPYVARIGDTGYQTVEAAVQSVADGEQITIEMTGDSEESAPLVIDGSRQVILDLAGYTLTGPEDACAIIVEGPDASLTLTDSSDERTGIVNGRAGGISTQDGGTFVMAGGAVGR